MKSTGEIFTEDVAGMSSSECGLGTGSNISLKNPHNQKRKKESKIWKEKFNAANGLINERWINICMS